MAPSPADLVFIGLFLAIVLGVAAWVVRHYALDAVARRVAQVLRLDRRALAVGAILVLACAGVLATVASTAAPLVSGLVGVLLLAGAAGLTVAVANLDWYRASGSLPVQSPHEVEPGPVQLEGTVAAGDDGVESSVTQTEAVAYQAATLEERSVLGRGYEGSVWSPTSTAFDAAPFGLEGAAVEVDGPAAAFPLLAPHSRVLEFTPAADAIAGLERTIPAEPGAPVPVNDDLDRGERPRPRRYTERRIDPGNDVYVLGTAVPTNDGLRIVDDPDGPPLIVARCTPHAARSQVWRLVVGYGLLGLASLAAALATAWFWL